MWGISFSGGGQRGLAHLGVFKGLQEDKVPIGAVSGTSVGAILAAALALGITYDQLEEVTKGLSTGDVLDLRFNLWGFLKTYVRILLGRFKFEETTYWSLLKGDKLTKILKKLYGKILISEVQLPIAITAVDVNSGKDVIFTNKPVLFSDFEGIVMDNIPLYLAVRSSIAIPLIYKGVVFNEYHLVDGGLTNNTPINLVKKMGTNSTISVEVSSKPPFSSKPNGLIELGGRLISIAIDNSKYYSEAEIYIEPKLPDVSLGDFDETKKIIEKGYEIYLKNREKILKKY